MRLPTELYIGIKRFKAANIDDIAGGIANAGTYVGTYGGIYAGVLAGT